MKKLNSTIIECCTVYEDRRQRMDSRHGIRTVETAAQHGLGSRDCEIISLD